MVLSLLVACHQHPNFISFISSAQLGFGHQSQLHITKDSANTSITCAAKPVKSAKLQREAGGVRPAELPNGYCREFDSSHKTQPWPPAPLSQVFFVRLSKGKVIAAAGVEVDGVHVCFKEKCNL